MTDWTTIASLATAGGTLVLALATFASVRSANRSYTDEEGAQRAITAFLLAPGKERWLCSAVRHWNLDRPDPR